MRAGAPRATCRDYLRTPLPGLAAGTPPNTRFAREGERHRLASFARGRDSIYRLPTTDYRLPTTDYRLLARRSRAQEVLKQRHALCGHDAFRVELDAVHRQLLVADALDNSVFAVRHRLENIG